MEEMEITGIQTVRSLSSREMALTAYPFYILHFVFRGSGYFNGRHIRAGQMFLVRKNEPAAWRPEPDDPWEYGYVNGNGRAFEEMLLKMGFGAASVLPFRFPRQTEALFRLGLHPVDRLYHEGLFTSICGLQITPPWEENLLEVKVTADQEFYDDPKTLWEGGHGLPIQYVDGYGVGFASLNDQVIFRSVDFGLIGANRMTISFSNGGDEATLAVYVDKKTADPAAVYTIPNTGGFESVWAEEFETDIRILGGFHDIIIEFTNSNSGSFYSIRFNHIANSSEGVGSGFEGDIPFRHLKEAVQYIESRFGRTTASECAERCSLSRSYLNYLFTKHYGQSLQGYILSCRIDYAASLLKHSQMTVTEIAAMTGYGDPMQFSKAFRKRMGKSPRAFRKEYLPTVEAGRKSGDPSV